MFYGYDYLVGLYQADRVKALEAFASQYLRHGERPAGWSFFVDTDKFITCASALSPKHARAITAFNAALTDPLKTMLVFHKTG